MDSKIQTGRASACFRQHETVVRMAGEGASLEAIAKAVGTNHHRVADYLKRHSIARPAWCSGVGRPGPHNSQWKGGRMRDKSGYWLVYMPDHAQANRHGYVREHRLVMERHLGRLLTRREIVDHRYGDKGDNRLEHLRLFASNGEHLRATLTGVPCPARGWTWATKHREAARRRLLARRRGTDGRLLPSTIAPTQA